VKKLVALIAVVVVSLAIIAPSAGAAVSFIPFTDTGSVDRSDVQAAFGWSNRQFAQNKDGVTFAEASLFYRAYICSSGASTTVGGENVWQVNSKFRGDYKLLGRGATINAVTLPSVGDTCPNGDGSTILNIYYEGVNWLRLTAEFNGQKVVILGP
jgi:hypothetical protein